MHDSCTVCGKQVTRSKASAPEIICVVCRRRARFHAVDRAMADVGVGAEQRDRVLKRLQWEHAELAGWTAGDVEAAQALAANEQLWSVAGGDAAPHTPEPAPGFPVFGRDFREIQLAEWFERSNHPLITTCGCGRQVSREWPESVWLHCS